MAPKGHLSYTPLMIDAALMSQVQTLNVADRIELIGLFGKRCLLANCLSQKRKKPCWTPVWRIWNKIPKVLFFRLRHMLSTQTQTGRPISNGADYRTFSDIHPAEDKSEPGGCLYPAAMFAPIDLPEVAKRVLTPPT